MEAKRAETERVRDDLFEQVLSPANLTAAWKRVKANGGAAGVDGMEVGDFPPFARHHWETIAAKLREGLTSPRRCAAFSSPKTGGVFDPSGSRRCWIG